MSDADVVVIGGGLAGLNAALQCARLGLRCTAFTGAAPGGLLLAIESVQGLPEHPEGIAGYDLGPMVQEAAMDAGAHCIPEAAEALQAGDARWVVRGAGQAVAARAVIGAPGCTLRALGVPGEERLAGRGVSHCASCDAPMLRGREVAVVGGGDAACQEALTLAAHASRVHLLLRGAALRARPAWRERVAAQPNIALHPFTQVAEILGERTVQALRLAGGATLAVDAVFVYAGLVPDTRLFAPCTALCEGGHIAVDAGLHASARGLFAAGSARAGSDGQAAQAAADGTAAADAAQRFLATGLWPADLPA